MNKLKTLIASMALTAFVSAAEPLYQNNFEQAEVDSVPDEFLVLDGAFAVKAEGGNKFLELPGAPLDTYGVLFGPSQKENVEVSARILGARKGRQFPTFDVGLNGVGGYRLRVSPAKRQLEILRSDTIKTSVPLEWKSEKWSHLKLTVVKAGEKWEVTGKFWQEGTPEPTEPTVRFSDTEAPPAGRASVFGSPYSGEPIRFDDLVVSRVQ